MILPGRGPWLVSVGLHLLLGAAVLWILLREQAPEPGILRMRLIAPAGAAAAEPKRSAWVPPAAKGPVGSVEPGLPGWRGVIPAAGTPPVPAPTAISVEDLLGPAASLPSDGKEVPVSQPGWTGPGGLGYSPPPLPPPGLVPPQGARWDLSLSVPGGGGFVRSFEGLNSGHADLDRWLDEYLRTVSFPSSPDGRDYEVRWVLRLESGRPQ